MTPDVFLNDCKVVWGEFRANVDEHPVEISIASKRIIERLNDHFQTVKKDAVTKKDEDTANKILALQLFLDSIDFECNMLLLRHNNEIDGAWDHFVDAEQKCKRALTVNDITDSLSDRLPWIQSRQEEFPRQVFFSPKATYKISCTICGSEYGTCHLQGKGYHIHGEASWGKLCGRNYDDTLAFEHLSHARSPASKKCRLFEFTTNGVTTHWMTKQTRPAIRELTPGQLLPRSENYVIQGSDYLVDIVWTTNGGTMHWHVLTSELAMAELGIV